MSHGVNSGGSKFMLATSFLGFGKPNFCVSGGHLFVGLGDTYDRYARIATSASINSELFNRTQTYNL